MRNSASEVFFEKKSLILDIYFKKMAKETKYKERFSTLERVKQTPPKWWENSKHFLLKAKRNICSNNKAANLNNKNKLPSV